MMKRLRQVRAWLRSLKDEHGSGTVFMILMLPVVLSLAGLAIDAAAAYRTKAVLQSVADAASLAAALQLPDVTAAQKAALKYANDNVPAGYGLNVLEPSDIVPGTWDPNAQTFTAGTAKPNAVQVLAQRSVANGNAMPTTFLSLIGIDHWDVSAQAIAASKVSKLWVSLVLDNTGSMCQSDSNPNALSPCRHPASDTKIEILKGATHDLLDLLQNAAVDPGDVRVSIVPFAKDVNVGSGYYNSPWLDWTEWDSSHGFCRGGHGWNKSQCLSAYCSNRHYTTQKTCQQHRYIWYGPGTWVPDDHRTWDGCIMDRNKDYDTLNTTPTSAANRFPPEQCPYTLKTLMPLTNNWSALSSEVDGMSANGSTNQTIGLVWGWQSMTQGDPLNPPAQPSGTDRIIILLSDGLNTANRWSSTGSTHNQAVDDRMAMACANAKADGVTIYAVYVDIAGAQGNSTVLQDCATKPAPPYYFDLNHSADISAAFKAIGQRIIQLRLVH